MPSPFPGMDPFIESQAWQGFHTRYITALGDALVPHLVPKYVVDVNTYVFLGSFTDSEQNEDHIGPDVFVAEGPGVAPDVVPSPAQVATPVKRSLPAWPQEIKQHYLTIRTRDDRRLITIIELLSPWNKSPGDGETEYGVKRQNMLSRMSNVVEIDLLRGGRRLRTTEPLPQGEYFMHVMKWPNPSAVDVFSCGLRDPLPTIPIPVREEDADVPLNLQGAFSLVYDRSGYRVLLDYSRAVVPRMRTGDQEWVQQMLAKLA